MSTSMTATASHSKTYNECLQMIYPFLRKGWTFEQLLAIGRILVWKDIEHTMNFMVERLEGATNAQFEISFLHRALRTFRELGIDRCRQFLSVNGWKHLLPDRCSSERASFILDAAFSAATSFNPNNVGVSDVLIISI